MNANTPLSGLTPTHATGISHAHESAVAQVAGAVHYIDDLPEVRGTLHAAPILSTVAHGKLLGVDSTAARAMPGVVDVLLSADIPGDPMLAAFAGDEPVFAMDTVQFVGQVVGIVVARTAMQARHAARKVQLNIEPLPAILSVQQALEAQSFVLPPVNVHRGDAAAALKTAPHTLHGTLEVGGQEHFYLEGQIAYAMPLEQNQWWIHSSTQHPGEVQHWVAHALALITMPCAWSAGAWAAALAARKRRQATWRFGPLWPPTSWATP
jgi:xanthine dehydrogenase large subunit